MHLAALSGSWLVAVAGFGGMRDHGEPLAFAPRLPSRLTRLAFRLTYRGRRLRVEVNGGGARYELLQGEPLELLHHGEPFTLAPGEPQELPVPPMPHRPAPPQPRHAPAALQSREGVPGRHALSAAAIAACP